MRGGGGAPPGVVLAATVVAAALVTANVSVLNVALPVLLPALEASQTEGQWMVDVYAVVLASLLLPIGAIGDRYGRRLILLVGMVILATANLATAALDTPMQVIVARGVAGVGAAFVFPATLSTITATLPDELRSRGIAMWTAAVSVGGFLGILGSGLLIENYRWQVLFLAMGGAALVVLALCFLAVPDSADPGHANLDPVGAVLSAVGVGALVLGIIEGPVKGWTEPITLAGLGVGVAALVGFVVWELQSRAPLLDVRLFANRGVRAGSISIFVQFLGAFGIFFLVVFHLGVVLGYGPLETGLALIPISLGLIPASLLAIPAAAKFGRRAVGVVGLAIMAAAFVYGTTISVDDGLTEFLTCVIIMGVGYGLAGPPATDAIVESLPAANQGVASALNDVVRELGSAIGIAVAGSAFNAGYRSSIDDLTDYPAEVVGAVRESPFALAQLAPELGPGAAALVADVQQAIVDGWGSGLTVLAAAMAIGALAVLVWAPGKAQQAMAVAPVMAVQDVRGPQPPRTVEPAAVAPLSPAAHPVEPAPAPTAALTGAVAPAPNDGPGPLGAIELAALAEERVAGLVQAVVAMESAVDLLERRSAVPDDMPTWPATEQVQVAERAALGLQEPLEELSVRTDHVRRSFAESAVAVDDARAEMTRLGRDPRQFLVELDRGIGEANVRLGRLQGQFALLHERFDEVAVLFSTLRPAAAHMADERRRVHEIAVAVGGLAGPPLRIDRRADPAPLRPPDAQQR